MEHFGPSAVWIGIFSGIALIFISGFEMIWERRLPLMPITAFLTILLPFIFHNPFHEIKISFTFGEPFWFCLLSLIAWEIGIFHFLYEKLLLKNFSPRQKTFFSPNQSIEIITQRSINQFGKPAEIGFGFLGVIWAPVAENIFYWLFLGLLLREQGWHIASLIVPSLLVSLRHSTHFFPLYPQIPIPATIAFTVTSFGSALILGLLFFSTHQIASVILIHFISNLAWLYIINKDGPK